MDSQQKKSNPFSSLMPIMLFGLGTVFFLQYFGSDSPPKPAPNAPTPKAGESEKNIPFRKQARRSQRNDFRFAKGSGETVSVETESYFVVLSSRGGRIERFYLKSGNDLVIPKQVIAESLDSAAEKYKAIEISSGNGMDFQFHLYYLGEHSDQLGEPFLNQASFRTLDIQQNQEAGVKEVSYVLPLTFRRSRLELKKIYRFYNQENYFRQITVLRNLESRSVDLRFQKDGKEYFGDLFYKPFGDISPLPKDNSPIDSSGKFFYYAGELKTRTNIYNRAGGGCGFPAGCTSLDKDGLYSSYLNAADTLDFMGSHSRYFFAYTEFLSAKSNPLHLPDGFIYKNEMDASGKEAMTAVFSGFELGPKQAGNLSLGSPHTLFISSDSQSKKNQETNRGRLEKLQKERKDALIIDNKVYVGVRSDESHSFRNPALMQSAFGKDEPNAEAAKSIHYSSYTALFSGIRDIIIAIMRKLYILVGNYGWSIIIIAAGFKLLTFPLNQMQVKGMQRMSALRPELDAINKQYADDPKEKQKRVMQLFKKNNYNPAKGCLPILIQMPIFIGLYSAFSSSIELWRSPFILWMTDLSRPDTVGVIPYLDLSVNILPLLMAASQIFYQRSTTVATDSQQKMLLYVMPLMMIFFFWQIPSGVTLYWTVQNFISIAWQQGSRLLGKEKKA